MSPCEMARHLEVDKVGTSEELRNTTFAKLDEWNSKKLTRQQRYWDAQNKTRTQIMNAVRSLLDLLNKTTLQTGRLICAVLLFSAPFPFLDPSNDRDLVVLNGWPLSEPRS